jgi:hypothetical protein
MNVPIPFRLRQAVAVGLASLPTSVLAAEPPAPYPAPPAPAHARTARDVEILYGTVKVWPIYRPAPVPVVPAEAKGWSGAPAAPPAPVAPPPAPREEPKPVPVVESRTIILAGYAGPFSPQPAVYPSNAPWLAPGVGVPQIPLPAPIPIPAPAPAPATPAPAAPPTVVVIREPNADARPAPAMPAAAEQPRGVTVSTETLLGIGVGVAGLGFGFAGWRRRAASAAHARMNQPAPPAPMGGDGMLLMGKYNAGPCPTTAEKFDLGPSYADEQREKKKTEEQNQQAVLEFILNQNLALHAELAGPPSEELPEATEELESDRKEEN